MNNYLAENLRELRRMYRFSQAEVADLLHIGRARYSSYEENRATPPPDVLISICNCYEITDLYGLITKRLNDTASQKVEAENKSIIALKQIKKIVENL